MWMICSNLSSIYQAKYIAETGLLKPWGQYVRTDDKMKGGAGADGKSKEGQ